MRQAIARLAVFCLVVAGIWLAGFSAAQQVRSEAVLALVGGRLIDGFGGPPLENSVILVPSKRIEPSAAKTKSPSRQRAGDRRMHGLSPVKKNEPRLKASLGRQSSVSMLRFVDPREWRE